jgi:isopenicillin N synthase-like dioxygenase
LPGPHREHRDADAYRLAEQEGDEFDEDYEIATIDIAPFLNGNEDDKARFAGAFAAALSEIGFAVLVGHGVDPTLYDEIHDQVLNLFETTPLDEKMRFAAQRHGSVAQGYFPIEHTSEIHPDLVEGWVWCRRAFDVPQQRGEPFRLFGTARLYVTTWSHIAAAEAGRLTPAALPR